MTWLLSLPGLLGLAAVACWVGLWRLWALNVAAHRAARVAFYDLVWNFCGLVGLVATLGNVGSRLWDLDRGDAHNRHAQAEASIPGLNTETIEALNCPSSSAMGQLSPNCHTARQLHIAVQELGSSELRTKSTCAKVPARAPELGPAQAGSCTLARWIPAGPVGLDCFLARCDQGEALDRLKLAVYALPANMTADATLARYRELQKQTALSANHELHQSRHTDAWIFQLSLLPLLAGALGLRLAKAFFDYADRQLAVTPWPSSVERVLDRLRLYRRLG